MTNPKKLPPSPKQMMVLRQLTRFQRAHGYCPSLQELADQLGLSKVTIHQHIGALERKGLLTRLPYRARSLQAVKDDDGTVKVLDPTEKSRISLLGHIAAGSPIDVYEAPSELDLRDFVAGSDRVFALKVQGDSMIDEQIRDGDYVVVEPGNAAQSGQTVVARLSSGEVTLKKFYREKGRIRLQPANPALKPLYVKEVEILGVVIGLLRKY